MRAPMSLRGNLRPLGPFWHPTPGLTRIKRPRSIALTAEDSERHAGGAFRGHEPVEHLEMLALTLTV